MNDQIAATAQSILQRFAVRFPDDALYSGVCGLPNLLHGGGDYTVRERFMASLPLQFAVMVVIASVFVANHMEDVLVVGHAHPWLGLYSTTLGLIGAAGAAFVVWNYIRESRRPYSISDTSEETATAVEQYKRRIVM